MKPNLRMPMGAMIQLITTYPKFKPSGEAYEELPPVLSDGETHTRMLLYEKRPDILESVVLNCGDVKFIDCFDISKKS